MKSRLIFALPAAIAFMTVPVLGQELDTRHYIYIEASAETVLDAQYATIIAVASSKAATSEDAVDANNKLMDRLLNALKSSGVKMSDIQTSDFGFSAVYVRTDTTSYGAPDPDRDKFDGYRATNTFDIRVSDLGNVSKVLGIISRNGVQVTSLNFSTSKSREANESTREQAVANAYERASRLAKAAHVKLGALLQLREGTGYNPDTMEYPPAADLDGQADLIESPPGPLSGIVPAHITVGSSISAKWEVLPLETATP